MRNETLQRAFDGLGNPEPAGAVLETVPRERDAVIARGQRGDNAPMARSNEEPTAKGAAADARETALIDGARSGDQASFEELVNVYQDLAVRTAYVIVGDLDEANDAAQDGFVKAFYALAGFRAGAPFRPWLLRIVANEAINRRRAAQRRVELRLRVGAADPPGAALTGPEEAAVAGERSARLLLAVNQLSIEDRLVIAYRYWFDLGEAEMAEALGVARGTVKSRLSRALGRLRAVLGTDALAAPDGEGSDGDA
jgi:RNA polymerase sigma factor (sigma-70 family)